MKDNEPYILIKSSAGADYICPLASAEDAAEADRAIKADICVEAEVAGRYAGQIDYARH